MRHKKSLVLRQVLFCVLAFFVLSAPRMARAALGDEPCSEFCYSAMDPANSFYDPRAEKFDYDLGFEMDFELDLIPDMADTDVENRENPFSISARPLSSDLRLVSYELVDSNFNRSGQFTYAIPNIALGLANQSEIQVAIASTLKEGEFFTDAPDASSTGVQSTVVQYRLARAKNEPRQLGWALLPGVHILGGGAGSPAGNTVEPSFAMPLNMNLHSGWSFNFAPEVNFKKKLDDNSTQSELSIPLNVTTHLQRHVDTFGGVVAKGSSDATIPTTAYLRTGLALKVGLYSQVDLGLDFGLNSYTASRSPFVGWTFRP